MMGTYELNRNVWYFIFIFFGPLWCEQGFSMWEKWLMFRDGIAIVIYKTFRLYTILHEWKKKNVHVGELFISSPFTVKMLPYSRTE